MTVIRTDENGRRYVQRADGIRVYVPTPGKVDPAAARRNREAIERYHRAFASTIDPGDEPEKGE